MNALNTLTTFNYFTKAKDGLTFMSSNILNTRKMKF